MLTLHAIPDKLIIRARAVKIVPPRGHFVRSFMVLATTNSGWASNWLIAIVVIIALGVLFAINRWRTSLLLRQKQVLEVTVKQRTKELQEQKLLAEQSEKYKEQFLANMSHEIRTPMHAISGMTNILLRNEHPAHQDKLLKAIRESSDNLLVLLNDILDLSKIEAGKIDIESIPISPKEVIENVANVMRAKAEEKGLSLTYSVSSDVPTFIYGDPTRLGQIAINLIGNGIKFTETGTIHVAVAVVKNKLRVTVKDTGIGIVPQKLEKIFELFEQAENSTTRKYGGTGLGLSITRQLVEMQHGRIWVESESGVGSEFIFELPLFPVEQGKETRDRVSEGELKKMATDLAGIRILLVEDNEFNIMVATDDLNYYIHDLQLGFAKNGQEAIEKFNEGTWDVILMDIQMPVMNGYDAAKTIREQETMQQIEVRTPIIAMTASLLKSELSMCFEAGMNSYIPKPYKIEEFIGAIHGEIKKSGP